jgi:hypothetical protein
MSSNQGKNALQCIAFSIGFFLFKIEIEKLHSAKKLKRDMAISLKKQFSDRVT